jgi:hypothetical protein
MVFSGVLLPGAKIYRQAWLSRHQNGIAGQFVTFPALMEMVILAARRTRRCRERPVRQCRRAIADTQPFVMFDFSGLG